MKIYSLTHRICAGILGLGGIYWAILLGLSFMVPPVGLVMNLLYFPGWVAFFGWWYIALGNSVEVSARLFWIYSATINFIYYIIHLGPWEQHFSILRSMDIRGIWWIFAIVVSGVCALQTPIDKTPAEQDGADQPAAAVK